MTGFKCGVALFLASTQLPKLFGIHGAHGDFFENAGAFLAHLGDTNLVALAVGGVALAILILGKVFCPSRPVALFVVVGAIVRGGRRPRGSRRQAPRRRAAGVAAVRPAGHHPRTT